MSQTSVASAVLELRERLRDRYLRFFRNMGVDPDTGDYDAGRKFASYPYVGSQLFRAIRLRRSGSAVCWSRRWSGT